MLNQRSFYIIETKERLSISFVDMKYNLSYQ
jgi:hypothetical protein